MKEKESPMEKMARKVFNEILLEIYRVDCGPDVMLTTKPIPTPKRPLVERTAREDAEKLFFFLYCCIPWRTEEMLEQILEMPIELKQELALKLEKKYKWRS